MTRNHSKIARLDIEYRQDELKSTGRDHMILDHPLTLNYKLLERQVEEK